MVGRYDGGVSGPDHIDARVGLLVLCCSTTIAVVHDDVVIIWIVIVTVILIDLWSPQLSLGFITIALAVSIVFLVFMASAVVVVVVVVVVIVAFVFAVTVVIVSSNVIGIIATSGSISSMRISSMGVNAFSSELKIFPQGTLACCARALYCSTFICRYILIEGWVCGVRGLPRGSGAAGRQETVERRPRGYVFIAFALVSMHVWIVSHYLGRSDFVPT